jgi:hypothetical protein
LGNGTLLEDNFALGADGGAFGEPPSGAMGGAVYIAGGTVNVGNTTFSSNSAVAGLAYSTPAASAFGGAIYVADGTVTMTYSTVTNNNGGGLYIASPATVYLDAYTVANTTGNSPNDISGFYTLLN